MVVYLWVSSTNKPDWYNWTLYDISAGISGSQPGQFYYALITDAQYHAPLS
jgi:hypothetical protein